MQGKVTLGYWAIRGLAERIRHICEYVGISYDQVKYTGQVDGESRKKWFNEVKPELIKKNPAITLPYLLDGDKVITQSDAIIVYICHKSGRKDLLGRNADEQVALHTALGVLKDLHPAYVTYAYRSYGQGSFTDALTKHRQFTRQMISHLKKFNGLLQGKTYICGEQLVWVDFALAEMLQVLSIIEPMVFDNFPNLLTYQKRIWQLPELKQYFESDRFAQRPCNNNSAKWR